MARAPILKPLGERQAILLAGDTGADLLVLDDRDARRIAAGRSHQLQGLLGLLDEAASRELRRSSLRAASLPAEETHRVSLFGAAGGAEPLGLQMLHDPLSPRRRHGVAIRG